jgi:NADH-quinone oxidoreductase subunit M
MQEPVAEEHSGVKDLNRKEIGLLIPACILIVVIGLYPKGIVDRISPAVDHVLHMEKKYKSLDAGPGH